MFEVGRDWKVFSNGVVDKEFEVIIATNIQLYMTNQTTLEEDEVHKQIYGWSENGSDEGSLLVEKLQIDGGRSIVDYESRACIFGRNANFLELGKQKMTTIGDNLIVLKFCARFNLSTRVHIVKGL